MPPHQCLLFTNEFKQDCRTTGSLANPSYDLEECPALEVPGCDRFIGEDCYYTGGEIFGCRKDPKTVSLEECRDRCLHNSCYNGCQYFVYDLAQGCRFFYSSKRICHIQTGPQTPSFKECHVVPEVETTTATTSTTTASYSTASTTAITSTFTNNTTSSKTETTSTIISPTPTSDAMSTDTTMVTTPTTATTSNVTTKTTSYSMIDTITAITLITTSVTDSPTTAFPHCDSRQFELSGIFLLEPTYGSSMLWKPTNNGTLWCNSSEKTSIAFMDNYHPNIEYSGSFTISDNGRNYVGIVVGLQDESSFILIAGPGTQHHGQYADSWRIIKVASDTGKTTDEMVEAILSPGSVPGQTTVLHEWPKTFWKKSKTYTWILQFKYNITAEAALSFKMVQNGEEFLSDVDVDLLGHVQGDPIQLENIKTSPGVFSDRFNGLKEVIDSVMIDTVDFSVPNLRNKEDNMFKLGVFTSAQTAKFFDLRYKCI